jgi:steroid delta-isomerase-like uncharacterized protein
VNDGDLDRCKDVFDDNYTLHTFRDTVHGWEAAGERLEELRTAFPDFRIDIEDMLVDGYRVVNRLTMTGTHEGTFQGIPPTHRKVNTTGLALFEVKDGKIVEQWSEWNMVAVLGQIGALPTDGS